MGLALHNAQACERIFLLPLWQLLGGWKSKLRGRRMWKVAAALAIARQLVLFLRRPGSQSQFSAQLAGQSADRVPLRELQAWIADHLDVAQDGIQQITVTALARVSYANAGQSEILPSEFVRVQSETALRHLANSYPYDDYSHGATSLRGSTEEIRGDLENELQLRLQTAGIGFGILAVLVSHSMGRWGRAVVPSSPRRSACPSRSS